MKFFHRSLKNRKLLTKIKDLHINVLNYLIKITKRQNHINLLLNLIPLCFQKTLFPLFGRFEIFYEFGKYDCDWKVTKIYTHFTFEQSCFKRDFLLNNQRKRQRAKTSTEKDFFINL